MTQQNQSPVVTDEMVERAAEALWPSVSPTWAEAYSSPETSHNGYQVAYWLRKARAALEAALPSGVRVKPDWYLTQVADALESYVKGLPPSHYSHRYTKPAIEALREAALSAIEPIQAQGDGIADAVLAWMVKYDLLDADNEYQAADVIAVLDELAPQPSHAETVDPYAAAPAPDELEVVAHIVEGGDLRWVQFSDQLADADKDLASVHPLVRLTDAQAAIAAKDKAIGDLHDRLFVEGEAVTFYRAASVTNRKRAEARVAELEKALEQARKRFRNARGAIESNQVVDKDVHGMMQRGMDEIDATLHHEREG